MKQQQKAEDRSQLSTPTMIVLPAAGTTPFWFDESTCYHFWKCDSNCSKRETRRPQQRIIRQVRYTERYSCDTSTKHKIAAATAQGTTNLPKMRLTKSSCRCTRKQRPCGCQLTMCVRLSISTIDSISCRRKGNVLPPLSGPSVEGGATFEKS